MSSDNFNCVADCLNDFNTYANSTDALFKKCVKCNNSMPFCLECSNSTVCTQCAGNYYLKSDQK